MNPYDFGTFHFMFQCDELANQEFIKKKGYKKLNHNQLGELAEIYFFIRIRLSQLSEAAKPKNDKESKIQKEVNSTKIVNLTFTNFIKKNFNIDEKHHSKILKPIVDSLDEKKNKPQISKKEALKIVKNVGEELENLPTHFKKDKEIVLAAVKQSGRALQYADKSFLIDKDIVLVAVKQNGFAICMADKSFRKDKEIV
jgi:hypothetical protein